MGLAKKIKQNYNKIASTRRKKIWVNNNEFKNKIVNFFKIPENQKILDVGIGAGDLVGLFQNQKDITGIDISKEMLNECKKNNPNYKLICSDAKKLPFEDESFDVVMCRNFLQNFEDPSKPFKEMTRVLKKQGICIIVESAVYKEETQYPTIFCRVTEEYHPMFPSHEGLYDMFKKNKYKNIKQKVVGVHGKWFQKRIKSKQTDQNKIKKAYEICLSYPETYKKDYKFTFYPKENEIESTLTFSFIKGYK